jgi:D-lyxose ketol-isomerase
VKRSQINAIMKEAESFWTQQGFHLPPFAYWTAEDWATKGEEVAEIVDRRLGWDITDFGRDDFCKCGLAIFTLRNGAPENLTKGEGKVYAEKVLMIDHDQFCPFHFHWIKVEDLINRGGGDLVFQVYNSKKDGSVAETPVHLTMDGVQRTIDAGTVMTLRPGESVTFPTTVYHKLWGRRSRVMIVEVSTVNNDDTDNRFLEPVGRFPSVEEDERPRFLLRQDYEKHYRGKSSRRKSPAAKAAASRR